jgi:FkbH-like protein
MFQVDWAERKQWEQEATPARVENSRVSRESVKRTALLHWEEHCQECAIPTCYTSCSLYVPRADQKCARFFYGIYPNTRFKGLFDFGADIRFRRWAKLEAQIYGKTSSVAQHRLLDTVNRSITRPLTERAKTLFAKVRNKYLVRIAPAGEDAAFDEFVLECFSPELENFRLILEHFDTEVKSRNSFQIKPGWNLHRLPAEGFQFASGRRSGKILLYPENNEEKRVIFTWLDFVAYNNPEHLKREDQPKALEPAKHVKCVAWDLDNTLWKGILAEDTETGLTPRAEALALVKKLDERGIIQTIVSKNNFDQAWAIVEKLDLRDYFLHPAINWQPKSANLRQIAGELNLNLDSFALIDDSAFERAEVQSSLPQVRTYRDDEIETLLSRDEFDVPVTELSRRRRETYLTEARRTQEKEAFGDDYESFLRSCGMKLRLFVPRQEGHIARCLELIQRANQLNLSNTRYSAAEFDALLSCPGTLCIAMECEDRFGQYGIVGFASVDERSETATLRDFVLSCRVAQKRVEHAFLEWLANRELVERRRPLAAEIVTTDRNTPIVEVFQQVFQQLGGKIDKKVLVLNELNLRMRAKTVATIVLEVSAELSSTEAINAPVL